MKRLLFLLFITLTSQLITSVAIAKQDDKNNTWHQYNGSNTVFIFVHGIFSNSVDCWTAENDVFWPNLVKLDSRLGKPDIFLGGYYTNFSSGIYNIGDAAEELRVSLSIEDEKGSKPPLNKDNIVFIAHSTGGLVVRYLIESNPELFEGKRLGLVLMASPSRGSAWANRLSFLHRFFKNKMAEQLEKDSFAVDDLDRRFKRLLDKKKIKHFVGVDIFENKFILPGLFWDTEEVVPARDNSTYFGAYKIIPDSEHFSIVKPDSSSSASHKFLVEFYASRFLPIKKHSEVVSTEDEKLIFPSTIVEISGVRAQFSLI